MTTTATFHAYDIKTGSHLREATDQEISAFRAKFPVWAFRARVVIGDVAIEDNVTGLGQLDPTTPLLW